MLNRAISPLDLGKATTVFNIDSAVAGSETVSFFIDSDSVLVSLEVESVSANLDVKVYTQGTGGNIEMEIISFPTISAPTTDLLLKKAALSMDKVRVEVTYTGAVKFILRAKAISGSATSFKILGNSVLDMSQQDVTNVAGILIAAALEDRASVAIKNKNKNSGTLYIGATLAQADEAIGWPIGVQETIVIDVDAGQTIYAVSDGVDIDVRILESGG